ncbi:MAG: OmpA family protein [Bacteroides sp.]|nr:OmpA family protein [Bacteroides sp.]
MKKILLVLALASLTSVAMAQTYSGYENATGDRYEVFTNSFGSNWFISVGGGASVLFGDYDVQGKFGKRISPTLNASLGKWFTPGLGLRIQYSGLKATGFTFDHHNPYVRGGAQSSDNTNTSATIYKHRQSYMNLHGDILFNVSAMLGGYDENRVYEFIPYLGAGWVHNYSKPQTNMISLNAGLIHKFRLGRAWDLNIEMSFMGTEDRFDGDTGGSKWRRYDGVASVTAGLTYYFTPRGFRKPVPARQLISESELRDLRDRMNRLSVENQNLQNQLDECNRRPTVVERPAVVSVNAPRAVFFKINSSTISPQGMLNIEFLTNVLKNNPDMKVKVTGYADSQTGSAPYNQGLSERRAAAVVDAMVNRFGIDRSRISSEGDGGVNTYNPYYLNRQAYIEVVQ